MKTISERFKLQIAPLSQADSFIGSKSSCRRKKQSGFNLTFFKKTARIEALHEKRICDQAQIEPLLNYSRFGKEKTSFTIFVNMRWGKRERRRRIRC